MSESQAGTKIDNEDSRGVRGLTHAGGLASISRTDRAVPMPFSVTTPPVKKQIRNDRSRFESANYKNFISAVYAQSETEGIQNHFFSPSYY